MDIRSSNSLEVIGSHLICFLFSIYNDVHTWTFVMYLSHVKLYYFFEFIGHVLKHFSSDFLAFPLTSAL